MKKLRFLIMLLCISITINAQTPPTVEEYKAQEKVFWQKALQKIAPQISTGILYSRVSPFSNLNNFNSTEYNTANAGLFTQALSELYRASQQTQFMPVSMLSQLKQNTFQARGSNTSPLIDIGVLNTSFNFLFYDEENEANGGLKLIDGVFEPIAGKPSVFTKQMSLISPQQELVSASSDGTVRWLKK